MPYLIADDLPTEPAGIRFRRLVERGGIAQLPGAHNGMAALQAKRAGFEGLDRSQLLTNGLQFVFLCINRLQMRHRIHNKD